MSWSSPASLRDAPAFSGATVIDAAPGMPVILPGGAFASDATYLQQGDDLVLSAADGTTVIITGYFGLDPRPDLVTPEGGRITPALVDSFTPPEAAGQYAQAGQLAQVAPIGQITDMAGTAIAVRADGTRAPLSAGDAVFQGDVVETGPDSAVSMIFLDQTTFALGGNARLALDEMVYNPATQEGSSSFSILKGVFVFVSGQIAKTDVTQMTVTTPVATIGIRGTTVAGDVRPAGEESRFTVKSGEISITTQGGTVVMGSTNETTVVTNFQAPPSRPVIYTQQQLEASYGEVRSVSPNIFSGRADSGQSPANLNAIAPSAGGGAPAAGDGNGAADPAGSSEVPATVIVSPGFGALPSPLPTGLPGPVLAGPVGPTPVINNTPNPTIPVAAPIPVPVTNPVFDFSNSAGPVIFTGTAGADIITGSAFNDILNGGPGNDIISGGAGNDTLTGGSGNDSIFGGSGDDILVAGSGAGDDFYDGGSGNDSLIYSSTTQGITVNLANDSASGAEIGQDFFVNMETFVGGSGNDTFFGETSRFFIDGGAGSDTLSFANFSTGLVFDLAAGTVIGEGVNTFSNGIVEPVTVGLPVNTISTATGAVWSFLGDRGGLLGLSDATSGGATGNSDHYDDALAIRVGGQAFSAPNTVERNGTENHFFAGVQLLAGLDVSVDFKFMDSLPVVRQIVTLTNNSASTINTDVSWINNSGADSNHVVVGSSSGDLLAGLNDRYVVTSDTPGTTPFAEVDTFVMYGPDNPQVTTSSISLFENEPNFGFAGSEGLTAGFNVSVAPGQTVFLMLFAGINGSSPEGLSLAAVFDDTSNAQFVDLISDLSGAQLSATVNWSITGGTDGTFTNMETLVGGSGDDVFQNATGNTVVLAGAGDDTFIVSGTNFGRLDGGAGFDTLIFQGAGQSFDLTALAGNQLTGIEAINFGSGNNNLLINSSIAFSATSGINAVTGTAHSLIIDGNSGDQLTFQDSWNSAGTATLADAGYTIFQNASNAAQVFVNDNVTVNAGSPEFV